MSHSLLVKSPTENQGRDSIVTKRITMRDVAEQAGVQMACVSVVLNGAKSSLQVSPATRQRILTVAEELGYKRNGSMSAMAKGRFGCVAMLMSPSLSSIWLPTNLWQGIQDELTRQNAHLSLFSFPDEELQKNEPLPKILREWMADGLLISVTQTIPDRIKNVLAKHDLPVVWLNSKQEFDCVYPADEAAGRQATEDLIKLGHKHIAYVDLDFAIQPMSHYSAIDRYEGYKQAMEAAGLKTLTLFRTRTDYDQRCQIIEQFLRDSEIRPTAMVFYNSQSAFSALWSVVRMGLQVPGDISMISVGTDQAFGGDVRVTSYEVPEYELGQKATAMLEVKIADPGQRIPPAVLPFIYHEGNSVGPVPDAASSV